MKANIFVKIEISKSSGYIWIDKMFHESDIESEYEDMIDAAKKFGQTKWETIEGFKLSYLHVNVEFDGRKKGIGTDDVLKSIANEGLAEKVGSTMLGDFYKPTEKLEIMLSEQLTKRKIMAGLVA
ncbi:MAG: hypothetical protein ACI35O_03950 [Bacillaceae bacterium]